MAQLVASASGVVLGGVAKVVVASASGVVLGGVAKVVGSNLARGKISIGSVDSLINNLS